MSFGNVGLVTCLPGFTASGGVKCGVDADFVLVGSLIVGSPRSCGVPVCTRAPWSFEHQPQLTLDFAQKHSEYKTNEVSEKYTASHR